MSVAAPVLVRPGIPRVNLMPKAELERRERAKLMRRWLWGALGALLLSAVIVAGAIVLSWFAGQRLLAEQARTNALVTELAGYSEVSAALATESQLDIFRYDAMGSDFAWAPVMAAVQAALPTGVMLTGFDLTTGGIPQDDDPTAEIGLVGTLTLSSPNAIDIGQTVRSVRGLEIVRDADGRLLSTDQMVSGDYTYQLDVGFNQTIYSGDYAEGDE